MRIRLKKQCYPESIGKVKILSGELKNVELEILGFAFKHTKEGKTFDVGLMIITQWCAFTIPYQDLDYKNIIWWDGMPKEIKHPRLDKLLLN